MLQPGAKVRHGLGSKQQQSIYNTPCAFVFVSLQMMKMWGRFFFFFFFPTENCQRYYYGISADLARTLLAFLAWLFSWQDLLAVVTNSSSLPILPCLLCFPDDWSENISFLIFRQWHFCFYVAHSNRDFPVALLKMILRFLRQLLLLCLHWRCQSGQMLTEWPQLVFKTQLLKSGMAYSHYASSF